MFALFRMKTRLIAEYIRVFCWSASGFTFDRTYLLNQKRSKVGLCFMNATTFPFQIFAVSINFLRFTCAASSSASKEFSKASEIVSTIGTVPGREDIASVSVFCPIRTTCAATC